MIRRGAVVGLVALGLGGVFTARAWSGRSAVEVLGADMRGIEAPEGRVRVEVLNSAGTTGLARRATDRLRTAGLDVVDIGNARPFDRDTTVVVDRVGWPEATHAVAEALGIDNVRTELDPDLYVDVSVLLGRDWDSESMGDVPALPDRPWWDPRGWLGR